MQNPRDVEAVFADLGMEPIAYRSFPRPPVPGPAPAGPDHADGRGAADAARRRARGRADVRRPDAVESAARRRRAVDSGEAPHAPRPTAPSLP